MVAGHLTPQFNVGLEQQQSRKQEDPVLPVESDWVASPPLYISWSSAVDAVVLHVIRRTVWYYLDRESFHPWRAQACQRLACFYHLLQRKRNKLGLNPVQSNLSLPAFKVVSKYKSVSFWHKVVWGSGQGCSLFSEKIRKDFLPIYIIYKYMQHDLFCRMWNNL